MLNSMINNITNLPRVMPAYMPIQNGIKDFFLLLITIGTGVVVSTAIVSIFLQNIDDKIYKNDCGFNSEEEEEEEEEDYENKYLDEYKSLLENDLSQEYNNEFIDEKTPKGIIKMNYDSALNIFNYYSNSKD